MDVLQQTVEALRADPELGKCRFRARNTWIDANRNVTRVEDLYAATDEQEAFDAYPDEPPLLAGDDSSIFCPRWPRA